MNSTTALPYSCLLVGVIISVWIVGVMIINRRNKRRQKLNTYKVMGDKPVPGYERLCPKPTKIADYYLPNERVVITEKETFCSVEGVVKGWVRGRDVSHIGFVYKVVSEYGALLLTDDGEKTGEYLKTDSRIDPGERVTFGFVASQGLWIDMKNVTKAYRLV